ncbi:MAG: hypothetical protein ACLRWQ_20910 [Flavonifractor plautii]
MDWEDINLQDLSRGRPRAELYREQAGGAAIGARGQERAERVLRRGQKETRSGFPAEACGAHFFGGEETQRK